jgi:hypothetical protein
MASSSRAVSGALARAAAVVGLRRAPLVALGSRVAAVAPARALAVSATEGAPAPVRAGSLRYEGKTVIVTGGSRGIGEGIVRVFQREGARVAFCGLATHAANGTKLAAELNAARPGSALFMECDVTESKSMDAFVAKTLSTFGGRCVYLLGGGPPPQSHPPTASPHPRPTLSSIPASAASTAL